MSLHKAYSKQITFYAQQANACILAGDTAGFKRNADIVHSMMALRDMVGRPVR